jgi:hypothetical protein
MHPQAEQWVRMTRAVKEKKVPYGLTKAYELKNADRIRWRKIDGMTLIELNSANNPTPK